MPSPGGVTPSLAIEEEIAVDRLAEEREALLVALGRGLVPVVAALQVELVGLGVVRVVARELLLLFGRHARAQLLRDLASELVLYLEQVAGLLGVLLAPEPAQVLSAD